MDVNYRFIKFYHIQYFIDYISYFRAPAAAGMACAELQFGHWIQSSTQATNAERSGQVSFIYLLIYLLLMY